MYIHSTINMKMSPSVESHCVSHEIFTAVWVCASVCIRVWGGSKNCKNKNRQLSSMALEQFYLNVSIVQPQRILSIRLTRNSMWQNRVQLVCECSASNTQVLIMKLELSLNTLPYDHLPIGFESWIKRGSFERKTTKRNSIFKGSMPFSEQGYLWVSLQQWFAEHQQFCFKLFFPAFMYL